MFDLWIMNQMKISHKRWIPGNITFDFWYRTKSASLAMALRWYNLDMSIEEMTWN